MVEGRDPSMIKTPGQIQNPRGFFNEGNTCYLNALMQATRRLWVFREGQVTGKMALALYDRYNAAPNPGKKSTLVCSLVEMGQTVHNQSDPGAQLRAIGELLLKEGNWNMTRDFATRGTIIKRQCTVCRTIYLDDTRCNLKPENQSLFIPLNGGGRNIENLLNIHLASTDERECCVCRKRTTHGTRRTLCHGPYVILLMNAPFEDKQRNCMTNFDFVHQNEQWTLVAVTVHIGQTQDSGHHVAYCKAATADPWFRLDDGDVSQISQSDLKRTVLRPGDAHRVILAVYAVGPAPPL